MIKETEIELTLSNYKLKFSTDQLAMRASGSVLIECNKTKILCVLSTAEIGEKQNTFLGVNFYERPSSSRDYGLGKKNKQSEREIIISRTVDRVIRSLLTGETDRLIQINCFLLHNDESCPLDFLCLNASLVLLYTYGLYNIEDKILAFNLNSISILDSKKTKEGITEENNKKNVDLSSFINKDKGRFLFVASKDGVYMLEGSAEEIPYSTLYESIIKEIELHSKTIEIFFDNLESKFLKNKKFKIKKEKNISHYEKIVKEFLLSKDSIIIDKKIPLIQNFNKITNKIKTFIEKKQEEKGGVLGTRPREEVFNNVINIIKNKVVIEEGTRLNGREYNNIRDLKIEKIENEKSNGEIMISAGLTHLILTLFKTSDQAEIHGGFNIVYSFFPCAGNEIGKINNPSRREIGHGKLATNAITSLLPEKIPTIKIYSDVFSSDGSSSMKTIIGSTVLLRMANIELKENCFGISLGLLQYGKKKQIILDIDQEEDNYGFADLKIGGTKNGICTVQLDVKQKPIEFKTLCKMILTAKTAILNIKKKVEVHIAPKKEGGYFDKNDPVNMVMTIDTTKVGLVIGVGGKTIKQLQATHGVRLQMKENKLIMVSDKAINAFLAQEQINKVVNSYVLLDNPLLGRVISVDEKNINIMVLNQRFELKKIKKYLPIAEDDYCFCQMLKKNDKIVLENILKK